MEKQLFFYTAVICASLSGLLSGFDTGVISGALLYIQDNFKLTSQLSGFLVSAVSLGAVFGALINGFLIDRVGRKNTLLLSAVIFFLGSIYGAFSNSIYQLIFSRIFLGFAVGIVSFAGPLYLSEISTKEGRGGVVSCYQIALTFGILFSYFVNYFCANLKYPWQTMLLIGAIPALFFFFGMLRQKDTPRWYVLKNRIIEAKAVIEKYNPNCNIENEIYNIKQTINVDKKISFNKKMFMPFVIGIGMMFVQIATGINAIIYYAPSIFKSLGFVSNQDALFITIFIGLINFLMTFVAFIFVDKLGRKPLLYIGLIGMLLSLIALSFVFTCELFWLKYLAIASCTVYIISFSMSLGPVALLLISEIFPLRYRGCAMSISIISNFVFNFIVTAMFPVIMAKFGGCMTFLFFAFICILSIIFVYFVVPETKGVSLEEIESRWV